MRTRGQVFEENRFSVDIFRSPRRASTMRKRSAIRGGLLPTTHGTPADGFFISVSRAKFNACLAM